MSRGICGKWMDHATARDNGSHIETGIGMLLLCHGYMEDYVRMEWLN